MKYIVRWSIKENNFPAAVERFKTSDPQPTEGVTLLARWHEMGNGDGFSLVEATDPIALSRFILQWADLVDQQIFPVVDDAEIAQALS
jgi:hypothetical protein